MADPNVLRDPESCVRQTTATEYKASEMADIITTASPEQFSSSTSHKDDPNPLLDTVRRLLPRPIEKRGVAIYGWLQGPEAPRLYKISPFLPRIQQLPLRLVDTVCPRQWQRAFALLVFYVCWIATFAAVLRKSAVAGDVSGYGEPIRLQCGGVFWVENNDCGLNGTYCLPFSDSSFAFRCPANCLSEEVQNPRAVGAQEVIYEPLVVGGPTSDGQHDYTYRGDSFICSAAIHAGIITNSGGGCGVVSLTGQQSSYPSVSRNGISSIAFDSSFPQSFTFKATDVSCKDLSWDLLAVSVVYTALLSLFTKSASVFFYSTVIGCYLQAALATDTPEYASIATLVSSAIGKLLPALLISMFMYRLYIRRTLHGLNAQVEKTVLWLGPCWVAVLADYTFELIPLERLTAHDIKQQPGGLASLIVIVVVLLFIFFAQAWSFRQEGRLLRYIALYICLGITIGLLAAIPQEELRLHHYILGLLLLPGTSLQTRPSLVFQGILVGLFINGVAKWGFDAILQTAAELQGDALDGSLLPSITAINATISNITFTWPGVPMGWNGTSVLVNDVERHRDYSSSQTERSFTWQRMVAEEPEYFRFGFFALSAAYGLEMGDYTMGGTWLANGSWIQMAAGAT
ncbi:hypothetical protein BD289DRAFT_56414 [Coniella lustricola]|uniref:LCCL domain-containing protein n=1 Tax=Coniella lustricola TaxID=2025994 RepID=A0A2T3AI92_9PEZI|nr:hypothetical protein BD289DRAFT_56414 [Coniella lustricola]